MIAFEWDARTTTTPSLDHLRDHCRVALGRRVPGAGRHATPDDVCLYIYTSGTTGPPKGCILTHGNYRRVIDMTQEMGVLGAGELVYLFLPLAHAFAVLIQFGAIDLGSTIAYWEKDREDRAQPEEVRPTFFPAVPRIFEKIHQLATSNAPDKEQLEQAVQLGLKVRLAQQRGEDVPAELREVRGGRQGALPERPHIFGGRIRSASRAPRRSRRRSSSSSSPAACRSSRATA